MLIARALPIMRVYIKPGGQRGYSGHCINLPQNVTELVISLPRYPKDLAIIIVKVKDALNSLPESGVLPDLTTVETDDDIVSDAGPPTGNPSEDIVYDDSTEMSRFLLVGEQRQQEIEAVRSQLSENEPIPWPWTENGP
ncbi:Hypothetical predicted protein [Paramuricea clavata]|uniref:DUF6570 domain-containing protein n=1 Tax=Paramuricea clavata TaxID=317549 RepID=A0A6S7HDL4_PARCT|nr:Hypothetical predicted protein [Paramuricea clavata]